MLGRFFVLIMWKYSVLLKDFFLSFFKGNLYSSSCPLVQFSCSVVSDSLRPHGLQHIMLPCPSPPLGACSNSCARSQWCHPTISSSVVPFSCSQSFPASGSFPVSQFFVSSGQSIGVSASPSVLPMNIQDWFPLGLTGFISLQSKELLVKLPGFWFDCFLLVYCILFFGCVVLIIFSRNVKKHNVFHKMFVFPLSDYNQLEILFSLEY